MIIRNANIEILFNSINHYIKNGYSVKCISTEWEWRFWRYVKIYIVQMKPEKRLVFDWGPVAERPIPMGPEFGDSKCLY